MTNIKFLVWMLCYMLVTSIVESQAQNVESSEAALFLVPSSYEAEPDLSVLSVEPATPIPDNASTVKPSIPIKGKGHASIKTQIEDLILEIMGDSIPGATVAVSRHGRLVFNEAFGYANYDKRLPMQTYHRSYIGSVSKVISALAIMKLVEENPKFHLNRKLYFDGGILDSPAIREAIQKASKEVGRPEWVEWFGKMRVKHLLSHTVGYDWNGDPYATARMFGVGRYEITPEQLHIHAISTKKLKAEPGTKYFYSNHAVGLSRPIIEKLTGIPYGRYVNQKIFQPLGLDIKKNHDPRDNHSAFTHGYNESRGIFTRKWDERPGGLDRVSAAGGWASSAHDLVRLLVATDQRSNYPDILKPSKLDIMERRPFPDVGRSHAIGWRTNATDARNPNLKVSHSGSVKYGSAIMVKYKKDFVSVEGYDMSDINVAICFNIQRFGDSRLQRLASEIAKVVARDTIPRGYDLFNDTKYRLADFESYQVGNKRMYAGIFRPGTYAPAAYFHHNWDQFLRKWRELENQGYRMHDFESYMNGNRRMYSGIFKPGSYGPATYFHRDWDQFLRKWRELENQGYRMHDFESYRQGDRQMYAGIFKPGNYGPATYLHRDWDQFLRKWRELENRGYRMHDFESYKVGDHRMYAGIFTPGSYGPATYFHHDWTQFLKKWRELENTGYRMHDFESYRQGNRQMYAGIFKPGNYGPATYFHRDWDKFLDKWRKLECKLCK